MHQVLGLRATALTPDQPQKGLGKSAPSYPCPDLLSCATTQAQRGLAHACVGIKRGSWGVLQGISLIAHCLLPCKMPPLFVHAHKSMQGEVFCLAPSLATCVREKQNTPPLTKCCCPLQACSAVCRTEWACGRVAGSRFCLTSDSPNQGPSSWPTIGPEDAWHLGSYFRHKLNGRFAHP